jgi:probable rRNA maturation factor
VSRRPATPRRATLELSVSYASRSPWAPAPRQFREWAAAALAGASRPAAARGPVHALSVRVVGTARSRSLNAAHRQKHGPTNVLSFAGAGLLPDQSRDLGELVICAPLVAREARVQGKTREHHWAHLTVHGVLHLLGLDHEHVREARKMESKEVQILDRLGFSNPYL